MARQGSAAAPDDVRVEGVRPLIEVLRAGRRRVRSVRIPADARTPGLRELRVLLEERGVAWREGPHVVASCDPFPEELFEELLTRDPIEFAVALDRVTDVGNLGSIARSAETAGCQALILEHHHAPPIQEGALRASAGAIEYLRVGRSPSLPRALQLLRSEGYTVLAAAVGGRPLGELPAELLRGKLVWLFGSEDRGLRTRASAAASATVGIELGGRIGSLGVAAAAAFLLHRSAEIRRVGTLQRRDS
jgi:tRNA G18 (ribose-2'-O)-methylase SpoU